tara:strand:- start:436 stop:900 length:465 start_codon:yes stop_codon:yes gene_type:complete
MVKKRSASTNIKFEKLDQINFSMEKIFDDIENIPDKEKVLDIYPSKLFKKKKQKKPKTSTSKPDKEIDLHGKTREESILIVKNFLINCHKNKINNGLIITGKGHNSGEKGPVLNREVKNWLAKNGDSYLFDFCEAPPSYGGSGAIWIKFKKNTS